MWKAQNLQRELSYDCDYCIARKLYEKRICFRLKEQNVIPYPIFEWKGFTPVTKGIGEKLCKVEDFYDILFGISKFFPSRPLLDIWRSHFRGGDVQGVCMEGVVDTVWDVWATLESNCKEYGWTLDEAMSLTHDEANILLSIRSAKSWYQRIEYEEEMNRLKQQNK